VNIIVPVAFGGEMLAVRITICRADEGLGLDEMVVAVPTTMAAADVLPLSAPGRSDPLLPQPGRHHDPESHDSAREKMGKAAGEHAVVIRKEQMRALEDSRANAFRSELAAHVRGIAPVRCRLMGDAAVRSTVALGLQRADLQRFTLRGSARFYVEAMFLLGSFFDTDCQYAALTQPLLDDDPEMTRADRLYESVMEYTDAALGPQGWLERQALNRAVQTPFEKLAELALRPAEALVDRFKGVYPEKMQVLGEAPITALINKARVFALEQGPPWADGAPLVAEMMFLLGEGCFSDPQYPWITQTLRGEEAGSEPVLGRLHRQFAGFAAQAADQKRD
jgi:hypothetical protein